MTTETAQSNEDYCLIPLSQGLFATVDREDFTRLSAHKWFARKCTSTGRFYARRNGPRGKGQRTTILMHRDVMGVLCSSSAIVDHKNRLDTLDNRKSNLRLATKSQNSANSGLMKTNSSGYKGVSFDRPTGKYRAQIKVNGKSFALGYRSTALEAYGLYCAAAKDRFGQFALLSAKSAGMKPEALYERVD